ncbi:nuclear transport factor 2 family protein [Pseudonocardia sp. N23]|uniref:nuclear transport factor 2 family protein n=1 Tax=Pseudonocardia sp. N23 TaxID=1987376 RepID=UPI000BFD5B8F|nr:nuclear transport factor 2 family protein [Pseudonocardia sp. N23]GAY11850.1 gamma-BHC dehydrochlorinase [Pseudonocardia sp. N23]
MDVAELLAREEIRDVLLRYCRGVDRGDLALLRSVYHPDATDDHGMFRGNGHEFAEWILGRPGRDDLVTQHHLTNVVIEVDGDVARAETYFAAVHRRPGPPVSVGQFGGRYVDRLARRDGVWRIAERVVVHDWSLRETVGPEWDGLDAFARGAQAPDDVGHRLLAGD